VAAEFCKTKVVKNNCCSIIQLWSCKNVNKILRLSQLNFLICENIIMGLQNECMNLLNRFIFTSSYFFFYINKFYIYILVNTAIFIFILYTLALYWSSATLLSKILISDIKKSMSVDPYQK